MNRPDEPFVDISGLPRQMMKLLGTEVPGIHHYIPYYAPLTRVNPADITRAINFALERVGQETERRLAADATIGQMATLARLILKFARDIAGESPQHSAEIVGAGVGTNEFEVYAAVGFLLRYIVGPLVPEAIVVISALDWAQFRLRFVREHLQYSLSRHPREVSEATIIREATKVVVLNAEWRTHFGEDAFNFFPSSRLGRTLYRRGTAAQKPLFPGHNRVSRLAMKMFEELHRRDSEILHTDGTISQFINRARAQRRKEVAANRRFNQAFLELLRAHRLPPNCTVDFINFSQLDASAATELTVCSGLLGEAGFAIQAFNRRFRSDQELREFLIATISATTEELTGSKPKNDQ